jgi:transglutaminase-like putative cysteine protease
MKIRLGYDLGFEVVGRVPMTTVLDVNPSRRHDLLEPDQLVVSPEVPIEVFTDLFGNRCCRFVAPGGPLRLSSRTTIVDSGELDAYAPDAPEVPVEQLPGEVVRYLLGSRYCEVDLLTQTSAQLFGSLPHGWGRVEAVCSWVHDHIRFGYEHADSTRTAFGAYKDGVGVCRDFQHLAIAFCRSLNIPARYVTGYLGDIGIPSAPYPMDFSAWFEAYLGDRWWTFDARHNRRRIGRVVIGRGLDATDVAITTSFGEARLIHFHVVTDEIPADEPQMSPTHARITAITR